MFDEFDTDNSGTIDAGEVQALLLGMQLSSGGTALEVDKATIDLWFQVRTSNSMALRACRVGMGP